MLPKVTPLKTATKAHKTPAPTPTPQTKAVSSLVEQDPCVVCKSDVYLNPSLRFLVSPCYHRLCENCVQRLFVGGLSPCPVCQMPLKKAQWTVPLFEDLAVERECRLRRRVMAIFSRQPEDFDTPRAYDDWLEEVEEIIWRLLAESNVQAVEAQLEAYRQTHLRLLEENRRREQCEEEQLEQADQTERERRRMASQLAEQDRLEEVHHRQQRELELVESLLKRPSKKPTVSLPLFDPLAGVDRLPVLSMQARLPEAEASFFASARCRAGGINPTDIVTHLIANLLSQLKI